MPLQLPDVLGDEALAVLLTIVENNGNRIDDAVGYRTHNLVQVR